MKNFHFLEKALMSNWLEQPVNIFFAVKKRKSSKKFEGGADERVGSLWGNSVTSMPRLVF